MAALVVSTTLSACGGGSDKGDDSGAPAAGRVREVFNRRALVNGKQVAGGDAIQPRAVVSTDRGGAATFSVGVKLDDCQIRPESAAQVLPQPGILLDYREGSTLCRSAPSNFERVELTAKTQRIIMQDPVWAVGVFPGAVAVRVFRGFVDLRAPTGTARLLGPDSQTSAPNGGEAPPAEHLDRSVLDQLDRRGVERMEATLPVPNLGFPPTEGSAALTEIRRRGSLRLGIDSSRTPPAAAFIAAYFDFLAQHWDVRIDVVTSMRPAVDLARGRVDVAIVPTVGGAAEIPYFDDDQQRRWSMVVSEGEPALLAALRTFLLGVLDVGHYGRQYRAAFGAVPSYEAVRPLVLPDRAPSPGSTTTAIPGTTSLAPTTQAASTTSTTLAATTTSSTLPGSNTSSTTALTVEIATGSATIPSPTGPCPSTIRFAWTIRARQAGTITYRFTRNDGASSPTATLRFEVGGTKPVEHTWTLGDSPYMGWVALEVLSPQPVRLQLDFSFKCGEGPF